MKQSLLFLLIMLFTLVSCGDTAKENKDTPPFETAHSTKSRETSPDVTESQSQQLAEDNTEFALDLYQTISQNEAGNFFYSPLSISMAMAMVYAGAEGTTESEIGDVMAFTLPEPQLHQAFNALDLALESRGTQDASQFRLSISNAIWGQTGHSFEPAFLDTIAQNYGSGLNLLDFAADPEAARTVINDWVEQETEEKITNLLPAGSVNSDTRLVLTNAIYFFGEWLDMFPTDSTAPAAFQREDGSTVTVDFMELQHSFPYYEGTGYEALELPYKGEEVSMIIVAPDAGTMGSFEATLDATLLNAIADNLALTPMLLTMPKFSFEHRLDLKVLLQDMGLNAPFDPGIADFSGIDGTRSLVITDILHKAYVAVNERGTEAAAATAVLVGETSIPQTVSMDRPFLFFVRDRITGTLLFMGRVMDPA